MSAIEGAQLVPVLPYLSNSTHAESYERDVQVMGRAPDRRITLHGNFKNPEEISAWWSDQSQRSYGLITWNCYTVIHKCLKKYAAPLSSQGHDYVFWTNEKLYKYCELLQWKTYECRKYPTECDFIYSESVETDFTYIVSALRKNAETVTGEKEKMQEAKQKIEKAKQKKRNERDDDYSEYESGSDDEDRNGLSSEIENKRREASVKETKSTRKRKRKPRNK